MPTPKRLRSAIRCTSPGFPHNRNARHSPPQPYHMGRSRPIPYSGLIQLELLAPVLVLIQLRLRLLLQEERPEHEVVHLGAHEAAVGVLGGADDGLASHVEAGVDDHAIA